MSEYKPQLTAVRTNLELARPVAAESTKQLAAIVRLVRRVMHDREPTYNMPVYDDPYRLNLLSEQEFDQVRRKHDELQRAKFYVIERMYGQTLSEGMTQPMHDIALNGLETYRNGRRSHMLSLTSSSEELAEERRSVFARLGFLGRTALEPLTGVELPLCSTATEIPEETINTISQMLPIRIDADAVRIETYTRLVDYFGKSA